MAKLRPSSKNRHVMKLHLYLYIFVLSNTKSIHSSNQVWATIRVAIKTEYYNKYSNFSNAYPFISIIRLGCCPCPILWGRKSNFKMVPVMFLMMTSANGNIFRVTGHLCGQFTGPRWIHRSKASDVELWIFFDLRVNKGLSKQPWGW